MVKEFGNSIEDSSEGSPGHCEGSGPSSALDKDTGDSSGDGSDSEEEQAHTPIIVREMPPCRMGTMGRPRAIEA